MLINLSNHPHKKWCQKQTKAANEKFGKITDWPFPNIDPSSDMNQVTVLAQETLSAVSTKFGNEGLHMLIAGEQSFVVAFVAICRDIEIPCYLATSERMVTIKENGAKEIKFKFVKFRKTC